MQTCIIIQGGECYDALEDYYTGLEQWECDPTKPAYLKRRDWVKTAVSHVMQVFIPQMPCSANASYRAWKIRFEKHIPYCSDEGVVLIGYSLGGWFLCKWLSENTFPKQIVQLHIVAGLISTDKPGHTGDFAFDHHLMQHVAKQCPDVYIYHSLDDNQVPYAQAKLLKSHLPHAELITFETRGHFFQPALPELLERMGVYKQ